MSLENKPEVNHGSKIPNWKKYGTLYEVGIVFMVAGGASLIVDSLRGDLAQVLLDVGVVLGATGASLLALDNKEK